MTTATEISSILAKRVDSPSTLAVPDGGQVPLITDSKGRLWTRPSPTREIIPFSASSDGEGVLLSDVSATTIHTATSTSGQIDIIHCWFAETGGAQDTVSVGFGAATNMSVIVPANDVKEVVNGALKGGVVFNAQAGQSATYAFGYVERITNS